MMALDALIVEFDKALRTLFLSAPAERVVPGEELPEAEMSPAERIHAAALMRVNHSGEVCAQALYQGQALVSRDLAVRDALALAAWEETEHLNWTEQRIKALGGRKSVLDPAWYAGALVIGACAGLCGERWNLGFLAETERQVGAHLTGHLRCLPQQDMKSRAVVEQMRVDESRHADAAVNLGGAELPGPARQAMRLAAKVMTGTAYWL